MQQNHKHFWEKIPCEKTVLQIASISPFSSAANSKRDAAFFGHVKKKNEKNKRRRLPVVFWAELIEIESIRIHLVG